MLGLMCVAGLVAGGVAQVASPLPDDGGWREWEGPVSRLGVTFAARELGGFSMAMGQGGGVSLSDYDDDGDVDLFAPSSNGVPNRVYRNRGDGTFDEVAGVIGLGDLEAARSRAKQATDALTQYRQTCGKKQLQRRLWNINQLGDSIKKLGELRRKLQ